MMRPVRKRLPPTKTPDRYGAQLADAAASAGVVAVGQVGAPYGVRGWLRIVSFTLPPSNLLNYRPWRLRLPQGSGKADGWGCWDRCDLRTVKPHGEGFIASFFGVADRDAALRLSGAEIGVPAGSLPPLPADEFYWRDLIGLQVLLSGDHGAVAKWQRSQALLRTFRRRPELLVAQALQDEDLALLWSALASAGAEGDEGVK